MEIYIVRHGQTVWNIEKRLQGRSDIELTQKGIDLAAETGENLKDTRIDIIYSSPLKRAVQTAEAIRGSRNIEIRTDDRLKELSFGDYEGHTNDELIAMPGCTFRYFFDRPELYVPGPNGETLEELCQRAADFMQNVIEPMAEDTRMERIMIVAHGAMNKALMSHVKQHGIKDFWSGGLQRNCNVIIIDYTDGNYQIIDESKIFYVPYNIKLLNTEAGLSLVEYDSNMYQTILQTFLTQKDSMQQKLLNAYKQGNTEEYAIKAHGLKGNAKSIGASLLSEAASQHALKGKDKDTEYIASHLDELIALWEKTAEAVQKYLGI